MRRFGLALTGVLLAGILFPVARPVRTTLSLSCPSRGLTAVLDATGFRIGPSGWGLSPTSWGRPGSMEGLLRVAPRREGERVRYERAGILEWHEARRDGIEQGFEILSRPEGTGPLVVEQEVRGDLKALKASPEGIVFGREGRALLAYQDLKAFDAWGQALPARMRLTEEGKGSRLALEVEDAQAEYPVSIDPLSTTAAWVAEGDLDGANFGYGVNTAGDVNGDGYSDMIVGAPGYTNGESLEGRAYVYHGSANGLSTTAAWVMESNKTNASFCGNAGTAGDVNADGYSDVIVGAYRYANGSILEGRAYVYHGGANGLSTTAAWIVESNQLSGRLEAVATAGDLNADGYSDVIVGTGQYDNGETNEGRAWVYHGASGGLSTTASWTVESNQSSAYLGGSNSTGGLWGIPLNGAGDVNADGFSDVIVGAYGYTNGETAEGRAYVYHGSSSGLSTTAAWVAESNMTNAQFGISAHSAGDVNSDGYSDVIVGANAYANGQASEGRAYVYHGSAAGLSTTAAWVTESNVASVYFGWCVGSGDVNGDGYSDVAVAADYYSNGETEEGRVFVYHGSASGLSTTVAWVTESNQTAAYLGEALSMSGDVNGDGLSDAMVGAVWYTNGQSQEGRAWVHHGNEGTVTRNTYNLPGMRCASAPDSGNAALDSPQSRVVRDSSGFWYVVWTPYVNAATTQNVLLSYTTTSTPTAATDWATVTLVASNGSGVIQKAPANSAIGQYPSAAMSADDQLHLFFVSGDTYGYWTKCTSLSALTQDANWVTPVQGGGLDTESESDMAVDSAGIPHVIFYNDQNNSVYYTKYDSSTGLFYDGKEMHAARYGRIALDLNDNVYILYADSASPYNLYLWSSTNAYTTNPAGSTWKNLAQTDTTADTVNSASTTLDAYTAAELCVDMNNIVHVAWRVAPGNGDNSQRIAVRDGRINVGWTAGPTLLPTPGPWKRPVAMTATGDGNVKLFSIANGGSSRDSVYATTYTGSAYYAHDGSWDTSMATAVSDLAADTAQAIWTERRMWRNRTEEMWFVANDAKHCLSTSWTDRATLSAGVRPPTPTKNQVHPHLSWWFPPTHTSTVMSGPPAVAHASKGCVYFTSTFGSTSDIALYAVDRSRGSLARSVKTAASIYQQAQLTDLTAATWGGNVHLFAGYEHLRSGQDKLGVFKWVDNGSNVVKDTGWSNNPVLNANTTAASGAAGPPTFVVSGGTRYVWVMLADSGLDAYRVAKIKADNGIIVGNYFTAVFSSWKEPPMRILNDQIFMPGTSSGLLRREVDGSAEIASSAISNQVLHLLQVRGADNNRLFVAPEDKFVYQLDSGLKTVGWASGKSANLGAVKTSGAYYSRAKNFIYVGVGNQLYRLNAGDGNLLSNWPMATTGNILTLPVQWTTFVYFGTDSGRIYAVNATTNVARANWPVALDVSTDQIKWSAFDAVTNTAYFTTDQGRTYRFNLE